MYRVKEICDNFSTVLLVVQKCLSSRCVPGYLSFSLTEK